MINMFLSSSFADVQEQFEDYLKKFSLAKTVTFIPTASLVEEIDFYVDEARATFKLLGFEIEELDVATADTEMIKETLQRNNFIYFSGGNSFFLLEKLKSSGAAEQIIEAVNAGKVYLGESAGAIVAAPSISYIAKMDDRNHAENLVSDDGLNLTTCYPLPHYKEEYFSAVSLEIFHDFNDLIELVPLTNKEALIIEDHSFFIR
ncbi:Type 1 glutamine amidotransferase-like domain-containing protein [Enterococcus hulanensis]|uniref:Type 1 glutamine amidotransferase-like domain-containing protein n=1 Tax=Enterococcus hulanensis TaxID=2559929 RepID=A0ABU3EU73_9ENTE|nr:Type 1 glutamine amidotransferase-like domain-containing protein [Enterococcus hulanensis]MDT2598394.1 Type 1 glutamine amidotransferase-like domain-containing protein [Enterococcus hulanensis]MDT2608101.1 Type 1 glutamine amidotransferase-like domain-containing protein [Enterococcus hulanensis]MDT2615396.1 Type 1 glutamine amidotransferase-like domain-containing protein [Enterococcus hulanensis]MDT2626633.1 Type 1 glutamine amidotransferase-like domain-containing protein [Enterococcus hulan